MNQRRASMLHTPKKPTLVFVQLGRQRDVFYTRNTITRHWQSQWRHTRKSPTQVQRCPHLCRVPHQLREQRRRPYQWANQMISNQSISSGSNNIHCLSSHCHWRSHHKYVDCHSHYYPGTIQYCSWRSRPIGRRSPGGGGGAPGGGGGGGGNPTQPTIGDGKPMGMLPTIFEGDHSKAESFLWEFSTYLLVNYNVPALASFIKRIAITLTCIKGPEVNWWTQQQLEWLMTLQPVDDNNTMYQQFIMNFHNRFMDSQKAQRARIELQTLKMNWPEIDEYICKFESIAHKAGYNPVDHNTMQQFLQGLPQSIRQKVLEDTTIKTYDQMKKKAINVMASQHIINALYKQPVWNTPWPNFQANWQAQGQCFQGNQNQQPQRQGFGQTPFNSTTAPRSWNNQPVPMDLDQTRAPRGNWRGRGRGSQRGNVARVDDARAQQGIQGACFNCREQGHFSHNCPTKQKRANTCTTQLIDWSPEDNESNSGTTTVDSIYQQLNALPKTIKKNWWPDWELRREIFWRPNPCSLD